MEMLETAATTIETASFCLKRHVREHNIDCALTVENMVDYSFTKVSKNSFLSHHMHCSTRFDSIMQF